MSRKHRLKLSQVKDFDFNAKKVDANFIKILCKKLLSNSKPVPRHIQNAIDVEFWNILK